MITMHFHLVLALPIFIAGLAAGALFSPSEEAQRFVPYRLLYKKAARQNLWVLIRCLKFNSSEGCWRQSLVRAGPH